MKTKLCIGILLLAASLSPITAPLVVAVRRLKAAYLDSKLFRG